MIRSEALPVWPSVLLSSMEVGEGSVAFERGEMGGDGMGQDRIGVRS